MTLKPTLGGRWVSSNSWGKSFNGCASRPTGRYMAENAWPQIWNATAFSLCAIVVWMREATHIALSLCTLIGPLLRRISNYRHLQI